MSKFAKKKKKLPTNYLCIYSSLGFSIIRSMRPDFINEFAFRCLVPECENANKSQIQYLPSWIQNAIPFKNEKPRKCRRFKASSKAEFTENDCQTSFNSHEEQDCDSWVFATDEVTIVKEVSTNIRKFIFRILIKTLFPTFKTLETLLQ